MKNKIKPFKDINEQIEILQSRSLKTDSETPKILLSEGYYTVVNGYKEPFLLKRDSDDFQADTKFSDIYDLFLFDRDLRQLTFPYLLKIEALMRTICTYTFSEHHQDKTDYLKSSCFTTAEEYEAFGLKDYDDNLHELHKVIREAIKYPKNDAVKYYKKKYKYVPLWVLMSTLTFGNIEHFYNLMKPEERKLVCKRIADCVQTQESHTYISPIEVRRALDILVKYRNICAHDERLYCAKVGRRRNVNYGRMLDYAFKFLSLKDENNLLADLVELVDEFSKKSDKVAHVLKETGLG